MLCDSDMEELQETLRHALKLKRSRVELGRIFMCNRGYIIYACNSLEMPEARLGQEGITLHIVSI